jgi:hypothetical protein
MLQMLDIAIGFATVMLAVSLVIMSLTQAMVSVFALRGAKLRRGLEDLIKYTAPDLASHAGTIAERVVRHPLVSDASTVLGGRWKRASVIKAEEFIPVLDAVLKEAGVEKGVKGLGESQQKALSAWFDSFMGRVSQWFTMNTRWITLSFAVAFALTSHFDSIDLFHRISRDSDIRARLSTMSAALLDQTPEATRGVEGEYRAALAELAEGARASFGPSLAVEGVTTREEARQWVRHNVSEGIDPTPLVTKLDALIESKLTTVLERSIDRARTLERDLSAAGITIRPPAGHSYRSDFRLGDGQHLAGILVSIAFLSLGAPFWFNLLKNVAALRSAVVRKEPGSSDATRNVAERNTSGDAEVSRTSDALSTLPALKSQKSLEGLAESVRKGRDTELALRSE